MNKTSWCLLVLVLGCGCGAADVVEPIVDEPVASAEQELSIPGICLPATCGVQGQAGSCGMQDDGCGGVQWCGGCSCGSTFRACELDVPVIAEATTTLSPNVPIVIETTSLSAGADSVLHLLDATTGAQLAMNDNISGSLRSRINYVSSTTRQVRIVVRAKSAATVGTATLTYAGQSRSVTLALPERLVSSPRAGDKLETVRLPSDGNARHVIYKMSGENLVGRYVGSGSNYAVSVSLTAVTGNQRFLVGRTGTTGSTAPGRLLRNDSAISGHDPDGDGLGTELEAAVGTCSSLSGTAYSAKDGVSFACNQAADARDTDGDALLDSWEVLGRRDVAPMLPLPLWGANPRHKDLFVEVDWGQTTSGEADILMTRSESMELAKHFEDRFKTLPASVRAAHAASIANPDGKVGIELHVDNGLEPSSPRDATTYGDWGGHSVVPPGVSYGDASGSYMSNLRRGVFKYGLKVAEGAGQGQEGGIAFIFGDAGVSATAHELAHTLNLGHSGPPYAEGADVNCKPNYSSLLNYAFLYAGATFSDGTTAITLNNAALPEWQATNPATQAIFLNVLEGEFELTVDKTAGHVDWNRDGHFAPAGQTVRSYANYNPGSSCQYTRVNQTTAVASFDTTLAPALGRVQGRTLVLHAMPGAVGWAGTTGALDCTMPLGQPCDEFGMEGQIAMDATGGVDAVHLASPSDSLLIVARGADGRLRWTRITGWSGSTPVFTAPAVLDGPLADGEPALALNANGSAMLVFRDATGQLYLRTFTAASGGSWGATQQQFLSSGAPLVMGTQSSPGIGLAPLPQPGRAVAPLMYGLFARPVANEEDEYAVYFREPTDGRWSASQVPHDFGGLPHVTGRPALEWVEDPLDLEIGGRLHVIFTTGSGGGDPDKRVIKQQWSYVDVDANGGRTVRLGMWSMFDNIWTYSYGIDLLFEAGVDINLRAAWTNSYAFDADEGPQDIGGQVRFLPNADGITDLDYVDYDDWKTMRVGLCKHHASKNTTITDIVCPQENW